MTNIGHIDLRRQKKRQRRTSVRYSGGYRQMQSTQFQEQQTVARGLLG